MASKPNQQSSQLLKPRDPVYYLVWQTGKEAHQSHVDSRPHQHQPGRQLAFTQKGSATVNTDPWECVRVYRRGQYDWNGIDDCTWTTSTHHPRQQSLTDMQC